MTVTREMTEERALRLIAATLEIPIETVTPQATWKDLGVDSLSYDEVILAIEDVTGRVYPDRWPDPQEPISVTLNMVCNAG